MASKVLEKLKLVLTNVRIYWLYIFFVLYPTVLSLLIYFYPTPAMRCLYTIMLMGGFYVTKVLPMLVTALLPILLLPMFGLADAEDFEVYLNSASMHFLGSIMLASVMVQSKLHIRIALFLLFWTQNNPRKLHVYVMFTTMFLSMWISNLAATFMVIPVVEATLVILECQDVGSFFKKEEETTGLSDDSDVEEEFLELSRVFGDKYQRKISPLRYTKQSNVGVPTKMTMCFYMGVCYAATIGGMGMISGTPVNSELLVAYKNIYKKDCPINEFNWAITHIPLILVLVTFTIIWLQFLYMGLLRTDSKEAKLVFLGHSSVTRLGKNIVNHMNSIGRMKFQEYAVIISFLTFVVCSVLRNPTFMPGWVSLFTVNVTNASLLIGILILLFILPGSMKYSDGKRMRRMKIGVWSQVTQEFQFHIVLFLGGSQLISVASERSNLSAMLYELFYKMEHLPERFALTTASLVTTIFTQFLPDATTARILFPVFAKIAEAANFEPIHLMMACCICASFSFCFEMSTSSNALMSPMCNLPAKHLFMAGLGTCVLSLCTIYLIYMPIMQLLFK